MSFKRVLFLILISIITYFIFRIFSPTIAGVMGYFDKEQEIDN
jgi:hypothetical protein